MKDKFQGPIISKVAYGPFWYLKKKLPFSVCNENLKGQKTLIF